MVGTTLAMGWSAAHKFVLIFATAPASAAPINAYNYARDFLLPFRAAPHLQPEYARQYYWQESAGEFPPTISPASLLAYQRLAWWGTDFHPEYTWSHSIDDCQRMRRLVVGPETPRPRLPIAPPQPPNRG